MKHITIAINEAVNFTFFSGVLFQTIFVVSCTIGIVRYTISGSENGTFSTSLPIVSNTFISYVFSVRPF